MNLDNFKTIHFKYKVCALLLLVLFGILFGSKNPVSMDESPIKISQSNYENIKKNKIMTKNDEDHFTTNNMLPKMDIELDNGVHITGAVLVHNGEGYALTEEEHNLLQKGIDPEEIVNKRK